MSDRIHKETRPFKTTRRALIEGLSVIVLGGLVVWPFGEIGVRAGVPLTVTGMLAAVVWGALMGYLLRDTFK